MERMLHTLRPAPAQRVPDAPSVPLHSYRVSLPVRALTALGSPWDSAYAYMRRRPPRTTWSVPSHVRSPIVATENRDPHAWLPWCVNGIREAAGRVNLAARRHIASSTEPTERKIRIHPSFGDRTRTLRSDCGRLSYLLAGLRLALLVRAPTCVLHAETLRSQSLSYSLQFADLPALCGPDFCPRGPRDPCPHRPPLLLCPHRVQCALPRVLGFRVLCSGLGASCMTVLGEQSSLAFMVWF